MIGGALELARAPEEAWAVAPGPWVESPFFAVELARRQLAEADRQLAVRYHDDGYILLPALADAGTCEAIREEVGALIVPPFRPGRTESLIMGAWRESPAAQALAAHPRVMSLLSFLYGRRPLPFQTLHFPVGSEQRSHSDSIHFSCLPARYMCAVWVALEDVELDSGPLFYYPGSHRLPELDYLDLGLPLDGVYGTSYEAYEVLMETLVASAGFEQKKLVVRQGDALVWASNLVHGGSPILRKGSSRWSQVTHYFFEGCVYYTPMTSKRVTGELTLRNNMVDIATEQLIVHSYNGSGIVQAEGPEGRSRFAIVPD